MSTKASYALEGKVLTITLDRPERKNPLTFELYAEVRDKFRTLKTDSSVKAVVLTGAGENFCSGGDVHDIIGPLTQRSSAELLEFTQMTGDLVKAMRACSQPVVAAIDGVCAGAGAILAMASDLRFGTERAKVAFLFVRVGLAGCDMGACAILPRIVGLGRASELLYTGKVMTGTQGLSWGFFNELCGPGEVLARAQQAARELAMGPTFAHAMTKKMLHQEWAMPLDEAIDAEARAQATCMETNDFKRAYDAFVAKKTPEFCRRLMQIQDQMLPFFDEEHRAFSGRLREWLSKSDVLDDERRPDASARAWVRSLASADQLRACVPDVFGGLRANLDVRTLCLARESLAYHSAMADFAFAMQGLGSGAVTLFGSAELQKRYLPMVANGRCIPAFALSEREAGSDVAAIATRAVLKDGTYTLDGEKTWISNAGIADLYIVFARTSDDGAKGLTAFAVDAASPGFTVGKRIDTMSPHPLGTLRFERLRVPLTHRIGKEGEGFKIAMATLDVFRSTVGAAALGFARRALDECLKHVKSRQLFGAPLAAQQLTQAAIAAMATDVDAASLLVYRAAWTKDAGAPRITREAAMAKWFATEAAGRVCDRAVQLFGGRGVTHGEIAERLYRDVRALRIYEGASEIQQLVIAKQTLEPQ